MIMPKKTDASSPSGGVRFATGTYTGDGAATQAVVGVGFQPKFVWILSRGVVPNALNTAVEGLKTDQDGVNSMYWVGVFWRYEADDIISLDADGFTVGDGSVWGFNMFNWLGSVYNYMCWG